MTPWHPGPDYRLRFALAIMHSAGLSLVEISQRVGLPLSRVSAIDVGVPSIEEVPVLAALFECEARVIAKERGWRYLVEVVS